MSLSTYSSEFVRRRMLACLFGLSCLTAPIAFGQPLAGLLDPAFDPDSGTKTVPLADNVVYGVVAQPNGQVVIGGSFTTYDDVPAGSLARLNVDGTLDANFNKDGAGVAGGAGVYPNGLKRQPDGKFLICGPFLSYNGVDRYGSARVNANGSLDTTFDTGVGGGLTANVSGARTLCLDLQANGQVVYGGDFVAFNDDVNHVRLARVNANGSLDKTFNPSVDATVRDVTVQPDQKILVCGGFANVNGVTRNYIARLNSDGSLDTSFDPGIGAAGGLMYAMTLQPDGKILAVGTFSEYGGQPRANIVRINPNGSLDASFDPGVGIGITGVELRSILLQPDGKMLIGGTFPMIGDYPISGFARLNANGTIDPTFDPGLGITTSVSTVWRFAYQLGETNNFGPVTNRVYMVGGFSGLNEKPQNRIARIILGDGTAAAGVTPPARPTLSIAYSGGNVSLSWPVTPEIFILQSEANLDNTWLPVTAEVVITNGRNVVTLPANAGSRYYRLKY